MEKIQSAVEENRGRIGFERARQLIDTRGLRFVEFWFTDLIGKPWRIAMAADALTEGMFQTGLPLDGQPVGGAWDGVMLLRPHGDTVYPDPAAAAPTLAMICDVLDPSTGRPLTLEPRHVLQSAQEQVWEQLQATVNVGVEPEFFLLDEEGRAAQESRVWDFMRSCGTAMADAGIQVDWFRTGPNVGQGRIQMRSGPPLQLADRVMLYRRTAADLARKQGWTVSFLPKPVPGPAFGAMPTHHSLWRDGENAFHGSGWSLTSDLCRSYAAGILAHWPALAAFCAPTTNSYRRFSAGTDVPSKTFLSSTRRAALCRIPARSAQPGARRVKFWGADSTANPYLALAAVIMAGLDGVARKLEPPIDLPGENGSPSTLEQAAAALQRDHGFLTRGGVFSEPLIESWISQRLSHFAAPVARDPHPWELIHADPFNEPGAGTRLN